MKLFSPNVLTIAYNEG